MSTKTYPQITAPQPGVPTVSHRPIFRNEPLCRADPDVAVLALSRLVQLPIRRAKILQWCGSVALIEFEPHGYRDPVVPVPTMQVSADFQQAGFEFVRHVLRWGPRLSDEQNHRWYIAGYEFFSALSGTLSEAAHRFTRPEYDFTLDWFERCLVSPNGRWIELISGGNQSRGEWGRWR